MSRYPIRTEYVHPPIPIRVYDWRAWADGNEETGPFEYSATERAAINDLQCATAAVESRNEKA